MLGTIVQRILFDHKNGSAAAQLHQHKHNCMLKCMLCLCCHSTSSPSYVGLCCNICCMPQPEKIDREGQKGFINQQLLQFVCSWIFSYHVCCVTLCFPSVINMTCYCGQFHKAAQGNLLNFFFWNVFAVGRPFAKACTLRDAASLSLLLFDKL